MGGLNEVTFNDSLTKSSSKETRSEIIFQNEVDRVYENVPSQLSLVTSADKKPIEIQIEGFKDTVVWNPWIDKSKAMADFDDEEVILLSLIQVYWK